MTHALYFLVGEWTFLLIVSAFIKPTYLRLQHERKQQQAQSDASSAAAATPPPQPPSSSPSSSSTTLAV